MKEGRETEMQLTEAELDELAKALHAKMEHLDPTFDPDWPEKSEHQRDFYRLCVAAVVNSLVSLRRLKVDAPIGQAYDDELALARSIYAFFRESAPEAMVLGEPGKSEMSALDGRFDLVALARRLMWGGIQVLKSVKSEPSDLDNKLNGRT